MATNLNTSAGSRFTRLASFVALCFLTMGLALGTNEAFAQAGNVYRDNQSQTMATVEEGVVLQVSLKKTEASMQYRSGGATAGGTLGAAAGYAAGGDNQTKMLLGVLGAIGGAFAGERVADKFGTNEAQEIVVGIRDPRTGTFAKMVTVVQPAPFDQLVKGDAVLVANTMGAVRILKRDF